MAAPYNLSGQIDWWRGDRGRGTHAYPAPSTYQQNSYCVLDPNASEVDKTDEQGEAVADMTLNWVYKTLNNNDGFSDTDWLAQSTGSCPIIEIKNEVTDDNQPGSARFTRGNDAMKTRFIPKLNGQ